MLALTVSQQYVSHQIGAYSEIHTTPAWPVRQRISHFWGAEICDNYKVSLPKANEIHEWIVKIDEINENILFTKITVFFNLKR